MTEPSVRWHDPGSLVDGDLELVLTHTFPGDEERHRVPAYRFDMRHAVSGDTLGQIELRIGSTPDLEMYGGHVGYRVEPAHKGNHFSARACRLLLPLARSHGLRTLWITCNPENRASRRTCELIGAEFVEIVELPPENDMYRRGERRRCRYRLVL